MDHYSWKNNLMKKILIIAAHPDDEILGCGGTIARLIHEGASCSVLILGEGKTSRDEKRDLQKQLKELNNLKDEAKRANKILGIKNIYFNDFPDNRFDSVDLLDIVKVISSIKSKIHPDTIFTHFENDLNIDHRLTYRAVITATRPLPDETVKTIYSFEAMSSTEWNYPISFSPNVFFDISSTLDLKLKALNEYKSEIRPYPHPRSLKGVKINAQYWGVKVGLPFIEAFKLVRQIQ